MPGCQSLTFEQLSGRWLPLSKSISIHSRGRGGGWRGPPPPSSIWSFALHPLLCWWTNDQQQLIYFSEVSLEIYFSEVSSENSRRLSNIDFLIVVWLLSIIVVRLLSSLFSPDMQHSLASACAVRFKLFLYCWPLLYDFLWLMFFFFNDFRGRGVFLEKKAALIIIFFSQQQAAPASIYYIALFFIPINLSNPKWSVKPFRAIWIQGSGWDSQYSSWLSPLSHSLFLHPYPVKR